MYKVVLFIISFLKPSIHLAKGEFKAAPHSQNLQRLLCTHVVHSQHGSVLIDAHALFILIYEYYESYLRNIYNM